MPLTLDQYILHLDTRTDLPWPAAPKIDPPKARPHLTRLPVKAVMWTVYGTLVAVPHGELRWEHDHGFVTDAALDKLIKEFKMWQSMSRKPGAPSEYMKELFKRAFSTLQLAAGTAGEVATEKVWDDITKKLFQKEYTFDAGFYGSLDEYVKKIAYFYQASIQGAGPYPDAADALRLAADAGAVQGLLADGQCFTAGQLQRCLRQQDPAFELAAVVPPNLRLISAEKKSKKPNDGIFKAAADALAARGVKPGETLHVGSNLARDIGPAKKHGFRTALFAGDKNSLAATPEQLKDSSLRPDVMLTELTQITEVLT